MTANFKCTTGADAGIEVTFASTTDGGMKALEGLIMTIRDRLNEGRHDGKVAPIVQLGQDSYPHSQHGKIWYPVLTVVDWMSLDGPDDPAPAPAPASPSAPTSSAEQQPRRRRVA